MNNLLILVGSSGYETVNTGQSCRVQICFCKVMKDKRHS